MRRRPLAIACAVAAALLVFVALRPNDSDAEPSGSFCHLYPKIEKTVAMLERGLEGQAEPGDLPVSNYRNLKWLVWSDKVAEGGPSETDEPATLIAAAVRTASTNEDPAPLQTPEFRTAMATVGPAATKACEGIDD